MVKSLGRKVKQLYYCVLDTKEDLIKQTIHKLLRIAHMYSRIEAMPIPVSDGGGYFYS